MGRLDAPGIPLYRQLAERLRRAVATGEYPPGGQLPTEEALGHAFAVSRITVRGAIDLLVAEGLLRKVRGRGTFVAASPVEQALVQLTDFAEDMAAAGLRASSRVLALTKEVASPEVAAILGLARGATVARLDRLRLADAVPFAFDVTYLPLRYGALLDRDRLADETLVQQLEERYGIPVRSGTFVIESGAASAEVAALLHVARDAPLLLLQRTLYTEHDAVLCHQRRAYRADRIRYRLELRREAPRARAQLVGFASVVGLEGGGGR